MSIETPAEAPDAATWAAGRILLEAQVVHGRVTAVVRTCRDGRAPALRELDAISVALETMCARLGEAQSGSPASDAPALWAAASSIRTSLDMVGHLLTDLRVRPPVI
ncbi:hypothetical protein [Patulibacter minatonensis]|uniref:hypothetical protein n=1 Tax=Patulibacter minatonensis TaxID=298163 RepID=UPI00047A9D05|nr:hypothetical protein [Patulibacter minatonensis]